MNAVAHPVATAEPETFAFAAGQIHAITDPQGTIIHCDSGAVWLTQAGLHDDVVLEAGASFHPLPRGKVILQALIAAAAVSIERT